MPLRVLVSNSLSFRRQDTLVMSNLGYFQLQTNPGVWQLSIAPGKHSRIYHILSPLQRKPTPSTPIVIQDFVPIFHMIQVHRNPGMELEALLVPGEEDAQAAPSADKSESAIQSMWDRITR